MIEFETDVRPEGAVITPRGRLDMVAAPQLRSLVDDVVADGHTLLVVDFSATEFLDSSGLGAVVAGLKTARQAGGDLRIANVTGQVEMVLKLTTLDKVLRAHGTVEEALGGG